jgi:hypothetical protein
MSKELKEKAINIKGKQYVLVSDRVLFFNEAYPKGSITTDLISTPEADTVIVKATVKPDAERVFTGYSQATWGDGMVNKTAALENAETSAVGRALAFMGIGVIESIASADEVRKATEYPARKPAAPAAPFDATEYRLKLESTGSTEELKKAWSALPGKAKTALADLKEELKNKYEKAGI